MEFRKVLARYYLKWYADCLESADYCKEHGNNEEIAMWLKHAEEYRQIIEANKEAIEFFSVGDRAFLIDSALPLKFRGYDDKVYRRNS